MFKKVFILSIYLNLCTVTGKHWAFRPPAARAAALRFIYN